MEDWGNYNSLKRVMADDPQEVAAGTSLPKFTEQEIQDDLDYAKTDPKGLGRLPNRRPTELDPILASADKKTAQLAFKEINWNKVSDTQWNKVEPETQWNKVDAATVWNKVQDTPTPQEKQKVGRPDIYYNDTFGGDLQRHATAAGLDLADTFTTWLPGIAGAIGHGLEKQAQGMPEEQVAQEMDKFRHEYSLRHLSQPENTEESVVGKIMKPFGEAIHGTARAAMNFDPMNAISALGGDEEAAHKLGEPDIISPVQTKMAGYLGELLAAKEPVKHYWPLNRPIPPNRRIGEPEGFNPMKEQTEFTEGANAQLVDRYNKNPEQYGVNEAGARNPYEAYYDPTPDTPYKMLPSPEAFKEAGPEMKGPEPEGPTFTQRHQKMVELGNWLIRDMEEKGLTPTQVKERFWKETYPLLPEEVQARFGNLAKRQDETKTPDQFQRMEKWAIALMHEANNYPWTPKAKDMIENNINLDAIEKQYGDGKDAVPASEVEAKFPHLRDSVVRHPETGELKVVYHGTSKDRDFKDFNTAGRGSWFSEKPEEASAYAIDNDNKKTVYDPTTRKWERTNEAARVIPVYLNIHNPKVPSEADFKILNGATNYAKAQRDLFNVWRSQGFDGVDMGNGTWVAFNKDQIINAISPKSDKPPKSYMDAVYDSAIHGDSFRWTFDTDKKMSDYLYSYRDKSLNTVLQYVADNSNSPFERMLAKMLINDNHDVKISIKDKTDENSLGSYYPDASGRAEQIVLRVNNSSFEGLSIPTLLHEAWHARMGHIIELGRDSEKRKLYPEYARFVDEMHELMLKVAQFLPKDIYDSFQYAFTRGNWEQRGSLGHEFISMAGEGPKGRLNSLLSNIHIDTKGTLSWYGDMIEQQAKVLHKKLKDHGPEIDLKSKINQLQYQAMIDYLADTSYFAERWKKAKTVNNGWETFHKTLNEFLERVPELNEIKGLNGTSALTELFQLIQPILQLDKEHPANSLDIADVQDLQSPGWIDSETLALIQHGSKTAWKVDLGLNAPLPPSARQMLPKLITPFKNYNQMMQWPDYYKYKDLNRVTGNVYPVTMVPNIANVPAITFAVSKLRDAYGDTHFFERMLVNQLFEFEKANKTDQVAVVNALNQMNRPEYQDLLKLATQSPQFIPRTNAQGQPNVMALTDQELTQYGMNPQQIQLYRNTLEPLFEVLLAIDQRSLVPFGRPFASDVRGYFPRSFGFGPFTLSVYDPAQQGKLVYYHRYQTFAEMAAFEKKVKANGYKTDHETTKDYKDFKGHLISLTEVDPKHPVSKMAERSIAAAEEHKRTQEFERNARGVAGFIGQQINHPKESDRLIQLIYHRIHQTTELYYASRLISDILRPLQADIRAHTTYPHAVQWIKEVIRRELGGDLDKIGWVAASLNVIADTGNRALLRIKGLGPMLKRGELTISPVGIKSGTKYLTAMGSAYVLSGNIPNLITNAASIPLVSLLGGFPDAMMLEKNPARAVQFAGQAHLQSIADLGLILSSQMTPDLAHFVHQIQSRGLVSANAFSDIPQMRQEIEKTTAERVLDTTLEIPRKLFNDPVEVATNYAAFLYYNRLVKLVYPAMPASQHFDLVVALSKRYTGDYSAYNKPMVFDKLGIPGQLASNFVVWSTTRTAQAHELIKNIGTHRQVAALTGLIAGSILVAGLQGMMFAQDYENFRQMANRFNVNIKPADMVMKDNGVPEWARNGVILNSAGVDLATRGKWAGWTDYSGVTYLLPKKAFDIIDYAQGRLSEHTQQPLTLNPFTDTKNKPIGPTVEDTADFVSALPTGVKGYAQQKLLTRNHYEGRTSIINRHGGTSFTQKREDKKWNMLGFRTTDQAEMQRDFFNNLWEKKNRDTQKRALKTAVMDELLASMQASKMGDKETAKLRADAMRINFQKLKTFAPTAVPDLGKEILEGVQNESDTPAEKDLKTMAKTKDAGELKMLLRSLNRIEKR